MERELAAAVRGARLDRCIAEIGEAFMSCGFRAFLFSGAMSIAFAVPSFAATIAATPATDHPTATIDVNGSKFSPKETIDIYFDKQEVQTSSADGYGNFDAPKTVIPAGAQPGAHVIR